MNFSVWASLADLRAFVYYSPHRDALRQRRRWFARFADAHMALWWVPRGHVPSLDEAKERLDHLQAHGETRFAFSFARPYPPPQAAAGDAGARGTEREVRTHGPTPGA